MVPVFTQTPPSIRPRSTTATVLPSFAAAIAAFWPPGPEPMTTRSYSMAPMAKGLRPFGQSRSPKASAAREYFGLRRIGGTESISSRPSPVANSSPGAGRRHRWWPQLLVPVAKLAVMTTSKSPDFHLNRPGVLIAALPAVLGFVPEKSLVLVTVDRGEMGCVMRVDLSDELTHSLAHIAEVAAAAKPDSAIAVVVDEDGASCRMCADEYRELADGLATALANQGIELLAAHVVDHVAAGGRWRCADGCGNAGI